MGKITRALKKAAEERMTRLDKVIKIQEQDKIVIRKMKDSEIDSRLITYFDSKAVISEQYKIMTTNLLSQIKGTKANVFGITSSIHSEGKSISSLNLAITLTQAASKPKVLLIDADMRRGRIHKYLGTNPEKGLSEYLLGETTVEDIIFNVDIDNLAIISAGDVPEYPAELLASEKMEKLLKKLKNEFDYVLMDLPPVIQVTDPAIIGPKTDGVIMVIQAGRTQRGIVKRAIELLKQSHTKIIGHVLTNVEYFVPDYIYRYL